MTIYTHWVHDEKRGEYQRQFFGNLDEQLAREVEAEKRGLKVMGIHEWEFNGDPESVAEFINTHCAQSCPSDLVEHFVNTEILGA
jgi:hypothetical protein